jgi:hypothetical protein
MPLHARSRAAAVIGIMLASAARAQEPPLPSTYFFPDSNAAMAEAFLDPRISSETKQALALLVESRRWPIEYQDPKTKLIWLYRPGMRPMLEGIRLSNTETRNQQVSAAADSGSSPARPPSELSLARALNGNE